MENWVTRLQADIVSNSLATHPEIETSISTISDAIHVGVRFLCRLKLLGYDFFLLGPMWM